jgi:deoxyribodipyrimidine photo-lyase
MQRLHIVWFKRDLRAFDHQPLLEACRHGAVLPLVIVEPELWQQPDSSTRQWDFCAESLHELRESLAALGQPLVVRLGSAVEVLERARRRFCIEGLWSHMETGNGWTYDRDLAVSKWANGHGVRWVEIPQFGVIRRLASRNGWARRWEERMAQPLLLCPQALQPLGGLDPGQIPSASDLGLAPDPCPGRQLGGRQQGLAILESFLNGRGAHYHRELSSPLKAFTSCSRLSAHLAWGTLSMREVVQITRQRRVRLQGQSAAQRGQWLRALSGFDSRLHWHCHFIQKLESEPELEFRELHSLTAGRRCSNPEYLLAWAEGRTGLPFVDACMRALIATGWINFRMRAMLMSVASYHLWLPWRESGLHLARLFVDYEPGIHWSQCQMQSGTTGINTIRIYNPIKQGQDHDPNGDFIRQWLPELGKVSVVHLHEPWLMTPAIQEKAGCLLGFHYPLPIVDPVAAARQAREKIWAQRQERGFKELAKGIQEKHGSRQPGQASRRRKPISRSSPKSAIFNQLNLDLN